MFWCYLYHLYLICLILQVYTFLFTASFVSLPADGTDGKQKGDNSTSTENQANYDEVYFDSDEEEMVEGNGI